MDKKVVIITINYNQNDYTLKCIDSLLNSTYNNFNILLIDNGSTKENYVDLIEKLSSDKRIIIFRIENNCGYVGGINIGLEKGIKLNPDFFLIMNNDTIIDDYAINELVKTSNEFNNKVIVSGKIYNYDVPNKLQMVGKKIFDTKLLLSVDVGINELDVGQYDEVVEYDILDDIFWLFPSKLYLEIGGYSPYFWFNYEQEDFVFRAKKIGYKMIYTPKSKIWHKGSVSIGGRDRNPNQAYWTIQSSLIIKYLYLNKIYFVKFYLKTIESIIRSFVKSIYFKLSGKGDISEYAKAKYWGFTYFNKWLFLRNENKGFNPLNKK